MCTGLEPLLFGSAATATTAATTGMIGAAGAFSGMQALMTAGTVLSTVSSLGQASSAKEQAAYQAQQTINEGAYKQDAANAQAEKIRKAGRIQVGEANAALAASGVKLGEGTALEVQNTINQNAEEDALSAILTGKRSMSTATQEADLMIRAGKNKTTSSLLSAGGSVLSGAARIYGGGWKRTTTAGEP